MLSWAPTIKVYNVCWFTALLCWLMIFEDSDKMLQFAKFRWSFLINNSILAKYQNVSFIAKISYLTLVVHCTAVASIVMCMWTWTVILIFQDYYHSKKVLKVWMKLEKKEGKINNLWSFIIICCYFWEFIPLPVVFETMLLDHHASIISIKSRPLMLGLAVITYQEVWKLFSKLSTLKIIN